MTPEAQRIAISEAWPHILFLNVSEGWGYRTSSEGEWISCVKNDPLSDLNAMHEAEKVLSKDQKEWYLIILYCLVSGISIETKARDFTLSPWMAFHVAHATAAQRAEAFLRAIGKWEE
jgi:hypothetical protein